MSKIKKICIKLDLEKKTLVEERAFSLSSSEPENVSRNIFRIFCTEETKYIAVRKLFGYVLDQVQREMEDYQTSFTNLLAMQQRGIFR